GTWFLSLAVVGLGVGCGLISSDITKVSFDLPPRSYRFDTKQPGWNPDTTAKLGTVPSFPCASDADCCSAELAPLLSVAGLDCSLLTCDLPPGTGTCAFAMTVETPPQAIDLKQEVPSISSISSQNIIDITVSQISYDVT